MTLEQPAVLELAVLLKVTPYSSRGEMGPDYSGNLRGLVLQLLTLLAILN